MNNATSFKGKCQEKTTNYGSAFLIHSSGSPAVKQILRIINSNHAYFDKILNC